MKARPKFNKTKLVATVGPACHSEEILKNLILAGVDVFRINFSHGQQSNHLEIVNRIRALNESLGTFVAILGDLQGPKLRVGVLPDEGILLNEGESLTFSTREGVANTIHVKFPSIATDVKVGELVLLDDGKIVLEFTEILDSETVRAKVIAGGVLLSNKGFNLPTSNLSIESMTPKDRSDLDFAIAHAFDWVALSFVREANDIISLRNILNEKGSSCKIIAKIEKPQAVDNLDEIIAVSDGIMVARGDLGVELPMERVPMIQKRAVQKCVKASKPVIIATQMMESMIENPTPTRAETSDVANAVMDGADAVMLSAETAIGKYPIQVVEAVEKILRSTEENWNIYNITHSPDESSQTFLSDEICYMAVSLGKTINAKAIISMTMSGYTAYQIASRRPNSHIFIFTSNKQLLTQLSLVWNVKVYYYDKKTNTDDMVKDVIEILKNENWLKTDDVVINTAAMPAKELKKTNTLKITRVS